jgi:hypothetical protein
LARDKYDHFALRSLLQSLGIPLRSATEPIDDTSTGKLMEGVLAAFAQFDNDCRSDRTRAGMKAVLELGRWTFLAPAYGVRAKRGDFEPLISEDLFYRTQAVLSGRLPSTTPKQRAHPDFPLRAFVRCECCGRGLTGAGQKAGASYGSK